MKDLKQELMEQARWKGICIDGYKEMKGLDEDALVDYYTRNPDWCMERDYPTLDYLRKNFADAEDKGVYIGRHFRGELLNDRQAYVFHNCTGTIRTGLNLDKKIVPMLYFGNGCRMRVRGTGEIRPRHAEDRSRVPLYIFGDNLVSAKDNVYVEFVRYGHELIKMI